MLLVLLYNIIRCNRVGEKVKTSPRFSKGDNDMIREICERVWQYIAHTLFASIEVMKIDAPRHPNVSKSILKAH